MSGLAPYIIQRARVHLLDGLELFEPFLSHAGWLRIVGHNFAMGFSCDNFHSSSVAVTRKDLKGWEVGHKRAKVEEGSESFYV